MAKIDKETPVEFIETTTNKLPTVQEEHPGAFIHVNDENGDDTLYIGGDQVTDKLNMGDDYNNLDGETIQVGNFKPQNYGELQNMTVSQILREMFRPIGVTDITLDKNMVTLKKGETTTLSATISPEDATNKKVTWTSSDSTVVSVSENGELVGLKIGSSTITATVEGYTSQCTVEVVKTPVTSVVLNKTSLVLGKDETTNLVVRNVLPSSATYKTVTWTSSDESFVTVSKIHEDTGYVKVVATDEGTARVRATADGVYAECVITIKAKDLNHTEPSFTISYNGPVTIEHGTSLPSVADFVVTYVPGVWDDESETPYGGEQIGDVTLTMDPDSWGEPGVGDTTYTITGHMTVSDGGVPVNDFGKPQPGLKYIGGEITSNIISITVQDVVYINGYNTGNDDGLDITSMRKYVIIDNSEPLYVTVPPEAADKKLTIKTDSSFSQIVVYQYNRFSESDDKYDIPISLEFDDVNEEYVRAVEHANERKGESKYKINFIK